MNEEDFRKIYIAQGKKARLIQEYYTVKGRCENYHVDPNNCPWCADMREAEISICFGCDRRL